jgi:hypothetical protein
VRKSTSMFVILYLLCSLPAMAFEVAINSNALASPVLDAKKAHGQGNSDLVGILLSGKLTLPGIKPENQKRVREQHRIRSLNRYLPSPRNPEQDIRALYNLKRYANRYNLMIMKLDKSKKLEQNSRYRY